MRMISVVVLAAVLAAMATATQFLSTSQADVKKLKDNLPDCSAMSHGRFGAFRPENLPWDTIPNWVNTIVADGAEFVYSPCKAVALSTSGCKADAAYLLVQNTTVDPKTKISTTTCWSFDGVVLNDKNKLATFSMPTKQDQLPKFNATYTSKDMKAIVVTRCPEASNNDLIKDTLIAGGWAEGTLPVAYFQIYSQAACPRFPYVPEGVPAGAVGAIIVCVIGFVVQMSICGYYHFTTKEDANPMD